MFTNYLKLTIWTAWKIDAWKILLFPKFLGLMPSFLKCIEMLCFVRNSGVGCFIWISLDSLGSQKISEPGQFVHDFHWQELLGTVIFPPSISLLDFCSTCDYERRTDPQLGCLSDHGVSQHQQAGLLKQAIIIREHEAGIGTKRPFKSILFQQLKIPIRWTSTCAILNLSPPKLSYVLPSLTPFSFLELSKKSEEKFIPKVLPPNWSNRLYIYKGCPKMFDNPSFFPRGNFDRALFFSVWKSRAARPFSSRSRQYSWQFWTGFKIIFCTDWKISASCLYLIWTLI